MQHSKKTLKPVARLRPQMPTIRLLALIEHPPTGLVELAIVPNGNEKLLRPKPLPAIAW